MPDSEPFNVSSDNTPSDEKKYLVFESIPIAASIASGMEKKYAYRDFNIAEGLVEKKPSTQHAQGPKDGYKKVQRYYVLIIIRGVTSKKDIEIAFDQFSELRSEIESIWQYVFGIAYNTENQTGVSIPRLKGWKDNHMKLVAELEQKEIPTPFVEFTSYPVITFKAWPLDYILRALDGYRAASDAHKFMMKLHATALKTRDVDIRLTLLGKLADLCETLLPGDSRKEKIKTLQALPALFKDRLVLDDKIFELANYRSLTRHAAHKNGTLHAGMTAGEIEDFQSDVDTIARYIAMEQLKIPPTFNEGWRFFPNRSVNWSCKIGKEYSKMRDARQKGDLPEKTKLQGTSIRIG